MTPVGKLDWTEVTEARYDEMLGMLPPAVHLYRGFLVGEPMDHANGWPRFTAFVIWRDRFFECQEPLTVKQFQTLMVLVTDPSWQMTPSYRLAVAPRRDVGSAGA